ncbi:MAG TPA: hypothetical protein GX525_03535, partial [Bacilli bacterium]|nr:hypothetical protein [Bacilli bacterium]
ISMTVYKAISEPKEATFLYLSSVGVTCKLQNKYKKVASFGSDIALYTVIDILIMQLYSKKTGST